MKKSLSVFTLLFCLSFNALLAQSAFSGNFRSYDQDTKIESNLIYKPDLDGKFQWKYTTQTDWGLNKRIHQEYKTSSHDWQSSYLFNKLTHQSLISYKKSDYDSSIRSSDKIFTNSGSLGQLLRYSIVDSLIIEGKIQYFYSKEEHTATERNYISNGTGNNLNLRYSSDVANGLLQFVSSYDAKYTDSKKFNRLNSNLGWIYNGRTRFLSASVNYNINREKIMATSNSSEAYVVADKQSVDKLDFNLYYDDIIKDKYNISLDNRFYSTSYSVDNSVLKNSNDWTNESTLNLVIPMTDVVFKTELFYSRFEKDFDEGAGDRVEETRKALGSFAYNFMEADTLEISYSKQLFRREYPGALEDADKDNLTDYFSTRLKFYPYKSIFTEFKFGWHQQDDIYINGSYSGNNYRKTDYDLQPIVKILLNDNLILAQNYQIYASYKDYEYSDEGSFSDRFYRKLGAKYSFIWDNNPLITKEYAFNRFGSGMQTYKNNFRTELTYEYLTSEDGSKVDDVYLITVKNEDQALVWKLSKYYNNLNTVFTPRYEWGDDQTLEIDWVTNYYFSYNSFISFKLNPEFEKGRDSIWELSAQIEYSF